MKPIKFRIIMSEPPGPTSQFIECETMDGKSFPVGVWVEHESGFALEIDCSDIYQAGYAAALEEMNLEEPKDA